MKNALGVDRFLSVALGVCSDAWIIARNTLIYSSVVLGVVAFFWTDHLVAASLDAKLYFLVRVIAVIGSVCVVAHLATGNKRLVRVVSLTNKGAGSPSACA